MTLLLRDLNRDQLDGLAKLCFDLAKGAFGLTILAGIDITANLLIGMLKIIVSLFIGIALTYCALVILKVKENIQS